MPPARRFPFQGPRPTQNMARPDAVPSRHPTPRTASAPQPSVAPPPICPSPAAEKHPLQALLQKLDGDTLLILTVLLLLSKEQTDRRLLLALAYIIL